MIHHFVQENLLINYKIVCRTAPATPGLLKTDVRVPRIKGIASLTNRFGLESEKWRFEI